MSTTPITVVPLTVSTPNEDKASAPRLYWLLGLGGGFIVLWFFICIFACIYRLRYWPKDEESSEECLGNIRRLQEANITNPIEEPETPPPIYTA
jgi:hypothetical protein